MSYALTYTSNAFQVYSQSNIYIEIYRKNGGGGDGVLKLTGFRVEVQGSERKDDILLSHKATIKFDSSVDDTVTNETFLTDYYDTWKVICYVDSLKVFQGFIEPSEGGYSFKSRPYEIEITCTDGIGLLKNIPLSDITGEDFVGLNPLIKYVAGALAKTGLDLPIRTYVNIFEGTMDEVSCMFNQARQHHRTYLKSANEFISCYETLEKILDGFTLSQWQDQFVISYRGEMFNTFGPTVDYYNYDKDGEFEDSGSDTLGPINIGKDEAIHPVNANQMVSWQPGNSSVKTVYNYEIPENLVNNEKMTELGDFLAPVGGYEISGWSKYTGYPGNETEEGYSGIEPYLKIVNNPYGFELERYFVVPAYPAGSGSNILRNYIRHDNEDFWVDAGDTISVKVTWRTEGFIRRDIKYMMIVLKTFGPFAGGYYYQYLTKDGGWRTTPTACGYVAEPTTDLPSFRWQESDLKPFVVPTGGSLLICLGPGNPLGDNNIQYCYKNLEIEYSTFKEGDKNNVVKGDFWRTDQAQIIKDRLEEVSYISDSPRKIFKGALFTASGDIPTGRTWYIKGDPSKTHDYKSLINWTKYQLYYRRFKRISGSFRGTLALSDNFETPYRLCFHKHFRFVNDFINRMYLLTGPCTIDYLENRLDATFVEVEGPNRGGNPNGDSRTFNYIF